MLVSDREAQFEMLMTNWPKSVTNISKLSATHFIPNIVTNIRYQHRCWFSHWCIIFWDRSKFRKLVFRLVYWKSRVCLRPVFVMQFEKVIHARFVPYKSNLSQIYFFPNSRSKVPFSSALILFKLRKYQFFRNTGSLLQGIWFNIDFPKLNGWIFQKTTFLKIFFFWGFEETIYVKNWYFGLHSVRRAIWNNAIQSSAKLWDFWESV